MSASVAVVCSTLTADETNRLPLFPGYIHGKPITVLRDTRATTAGVRASLVSPADYTGQTQSCVTFGGRTETFPVASIPVEMPFFTGQLLCCVIKEPVVDLILGNISGVEKLFEAEKSAALVTTRAQGKRDRMAPGLLHVARPMLDVTREELIQLLNSDQTLDACRAVTSGRREVLDPGQDFKFQDKVLTRMARNKTGVVSQVVIPLKLRTSVLCAAHDGLLFGHSGIRATLERVLSTCWWPGVRRDTRNYCQTCDICQKTVAHGRNRPVPLVHVPTYPLYQ